MQGIFLGKAKNLYEKGNHLGNVLVTVSDKKIGVDANSDGTIDYYTADVITANDYAPFGSLLPGRKYSQANTKYRYGFNGKENDNEVKGEGNQQDYGMRIYDPRLGKFLSVDPISAKYPELTPYQFASNSPISGTDLDGLEYLTAIYNVTIKNGINKVSADYVWYNNQTHSNHGPLGQGVSYQIKINNLDKKTTTTNNYFMSRGGTSDASGITQYGNYMGSDALSNFNAYTGNPIKNTYRYDVAAVDFVDQQAKMHDQGYDKIGAAGATSLFTDWGATPYDEAALTGWNNFYDNNKRGSVDPFNGQSVTIQERDAAWRGKNLFRRVVDFKKSAINGFMSDNYKDAKHGTKFLWGKASYSKKDIEANYQKFLDNYMEKDDKGNYKRKKEMWDGDKDRGFTPKKTTTQ